MKNSHELLIAKGFISKIIFEAACEVQCTLERVFSNTGVSFQYEYHKALSRTLCVSDEVNY